MDAEIFIEIHYYRSCQQAHVMHSPDNQTLLQCIHYFQYFWWKYGLSLFVMANLSNSQNLILVHKRKLSQTFIINIILDRYIKRFTFHGPCKELSTYKRCQSQNSWLHLIVPLQSKHFWDPAVFKTMLNLQCYQEVVCNRRKPIYGHSF